MIKIIKNFVEDLNYTHIILNIEKVQRGYYGVVPLIEVLRDKLDKDKLNKHRNRLTYASRWLFVENCDAQGEDITDHPYKLENENHICNYVGLGFTFWELDFNEKTEEWFIDFNNNRFNRFFHATEGVTREVLTCEDCGRNIELDIRSSGADLDGDIFKCSCGTKHYVKIMRTRSGMPESKKIKDKGENPWIPNK